MTDKEFKKLIKRTKQAHRKYFELLDAAEAEYEMRFGNHPSYVDDDYWIDTMHYPIAEPDFDVMMERAKESNGYE